MRSKELFFEMREEDMVTMYDHSFTKKKAAETGKALVSRVFEEGKLEPVQVYSNIVRLKEVIDSADKAFRERLSLNTATSWNGVTLTPKNGSEKLNYSEDPVCADLERKLEERKNLVKLATHSKDPIYDSEGCEVTRVSSSFTKSSITVNF